MCIGPKLLCRWRKRPGTSSRVSEPHAPSKAPGSLASAVLADTGSLKDSPSLQCAAARLRRVEDEHGSEFQRRPSPFEG